MLPKFECNVNVLNIDRPKMEEGVGPRISSSNDGQIMRPLTNLRILRKYDNHCQ